MIEALVIGCVMAAASPAIAFVANGWIEQGRRKRAFRRITNEPLFAEGTRLVELQAEGRDAPIMGPCLISCITVGRVVIRSEDNTRAAVFTGRELEALIPIVDASQNPSQ